MIEASNDSILGEQTWPSEEELRLSESLLDVGSGREKRVIPSDVSLKS